MKTSKFKNKIMVVIVMAMLILTVCNFIIPTENALADDGYVYYAFGSYPQALIADASYPLDEDGITRVETSDYLADLATIQEYEAEGREFYEYMNDDVIYWFEIEPVLWRVVLTDEDEIILFSEYILDFQAMNEATETEPNGELDTFTDGSLYSWLQSDFKDGLFASAIQSDFDIEITLPSYTHFYNGLLSTYSQADRLTTNTDYGGGTLMYFGTSYKGTYWLSSVYGSAYLSYGASYTYRSMAIDATGSWAAPYNTSSYIGVRPLIGITVDNSTYATIGTGTYADPYTFALTEQVQNTLSTGENANSVGEYDGIQTFELSLESDENATIYYYITTDGIASQTIKYDSSKTYYISKDCTLTAWATSSGGFKTSESSWEYTISNREIYVDLTQVEAEYIIVDMPESTKENFDIIKVETQLQAEEIAMINVKISDGFEIVEQFYLYATVNGEVVENPQFTSVVTILLEEEIDVEREYQVAHIMQNEVIFYKKDGLLIDQVTNSLSFDVTSLSPFVILKSIVEDSVSSNGSSYSNDSSGSSDERLVALDTSAPIITVDGYVVTVYDANLSSVTINGEEIDFDGDTVILNLSEFANGAYEIIATEKYRRTSMETVVVAIKEEIETPTSTKSPTQTVAPVVTASPEIDISSTTNGGYIVWILLIACCAGIAIFILCKKKKNGNNN